MDVVLAIFPSSPPSPVAAHEALVFNFGWSFRVAPKSQRLGQLTFFLSFNMTGLFITAFAKASSVRASATAAGSPSNFWLFSNCSGFDMIHPPTPSSPPVYPRVTMKTTNSHITVTSKTAFVIIDMQNFFLSAAISRKQGEGHEAEDVLLKPGIPAANPDCLAGMGISEDGFQTLPRTVWRIFGFKIADEGNFGVENDGPDSGSTRMLRRSENNSSGGIESPLGDMKLENGSVGGWDCK